MMTMLWTWIIWGSVGAARAARGAISKPPNMVITSALGFGDRQDGVESLWLSLSRGWVYVLWVHHLRSFKGRNVAVVLIGTGAGLGAPMWWKLGYWMQNATFGFNGAKWNSGVKRDPEPGTFEARDNSCGKCWKRGRKKATLPCSVSYRMTIDRSLSYRAVHE